MPSKRFKGIENFLRRLAYNLGNSPSQTEVKIISCIPIDVTDLQQKILSLEQQLEEARLGPKNQEPINVIKDHSVSLISENRSEEIPQQERTKDKESMNNTPDQSKNISLVTDVYSGQDTLSGRRRPLTSNNVEVNSLCVDTNNTYIPVSPFRTKQDLYNNPDEQPASPHHGSDSVYNTGLQPCRRNASTKKKSCVSFAIDKQFKNEVCTEGAINKSDSSITQNLCGNTFYTSDTQCKDQEPSKDDKDHKAILNERKKKLLNRKRNKTQYVYYYIENCGSPFRSFRATPLISVDEFETNTRKNQEGKPVSCNYLSKVIQRQYTTRTLGKRLSALSGITSPVCKDTKTTPLEDSEQYESNVCSEAPFYNIDDESRNHVQNLRIRSNYDSDLYDMVPVKEKPTKIKRNTDSLQKNEISSENKKRIYTKMRNTRYYTPENSNYQDPRYCSSSDNMESYLNSLSSEAKKSAEKESFTQNRHLYRMAQPNATKYFKNNYERRSYKPIQRYPLEEDSIDVIYTRNFCKEPYIKIAGKTKLKCEGSMGLLSRHCECSTTYDTSGGIETVRSDREVNPEFKTDSTINQIKDILQSVLTEVKESKKAKSMPQEKTNEECKPKTDLRQNYWQDSIFQKSFNYNPTNTPFMAPYSPNLNTVQFMYPQNSLGCISNLPILLPAHQNFGCYSNSFYDNRINKPTTTASTNTEKDNLVGSIETERLVNEIYKSIALKMASEETSNKDSVLKTESVQVTAIASDTSQAESQISKAKAMSSSTDTHDTTPISITHHSQIATDTETAQTQNERAGNYSSVIQFMKSEGVNVDMSSMVASTRLSRLTTKAQTERSMSRVDVECNMKKGGLFSKIRSAFKIKEKSGAKNMRLSSGSETSLESEQCSQKDKPFKPKTTIMINPPHLRPKLAKIAERLSEKPRRIPHLEPEKRYCDKLMTSKGRQEKCRHGPCSQSYCENHEVRRRPHRGR